MSTIDVGEILEHQLNANMLSMPYDVYSELFDSVAALGDENDRLRELCRMAWKCTHSGLSCSDCRMVAGGCTLQSAMRELGIEV